MDQLPARDAVRAVARMLRALGVSRKHFDAFARQLKVRHGISRGEAIATPYRSAGHLTILLDGIACTSTYGEDGARQILVFHHPGDFLGLHHYVFPQSTDYVAVEVLASSSIGTIDLQSADQLLEHHSTLRLAVWRAAMRELSSYRGRSMAMRRPALRRVAHILCEQLARRGAVGIDNGVIPLSENDVADAAGLSTAHASRTLLHLRFLGLLAKERQTIEVLNKERLQELAAFDKRYLDPDESLLGWNVRFEG
jgi:CRP-like cAMP-binding protein